MSITHRDHYVNIARRRASDANKLAANGYRQCNGHSTEAGEFPAISMTDCKGGFFADQFENLANFRAHYEGTGPEIWEQTGGNLHGFIAAAGTGGTVAGISRFLKVFVIS